MRNDPALACSGAPAGLLGDTAERDYSRKLRLFNAFAEPELRHAIAGLEIEPGMRILDAGCGTGEALRWLSEATGGSGELIGVDLSTAHVAAARALLGSDATVTQCDITNLPPRIHEIDLIWSCNTVNHLRDPLEGLRKLMQRLRRGGRIAVGQSSLVPEMLFAWDARLERLTTEAARQYYRDRYGLQERELASVRALVGWLRDSGLREVAARTFMIERVSPVDANTRAYLLEALFRGTWGERLRPYLQAEDYSELARLCDPEGALFALDRPDFHFLQSFTLVTGAV